MSPAKSIFSEINYNQAFSHSGVLELHSSTWKWQEPTGKSTDQFWSDGFNVFFFQHILFSTQFLQNISHPIITWQLWCSIWLFSMWNNFSTSWITWHWNNKRFPKLFQIWSYFRKIQESHVHNYQYC